MRLTTFADYALRVLVFVAAAGDRRVTIEEAAAAYGISRSHLMKVVNLLVREGFLEAVRGRGGGLRLARPARRITLGAVLRAAEPDFALVACMDARCPPDACRIAAGCRLPRALGGALAAFLATCDATTLADVALDARTFAQAAE